MAADVRKSDDSEKETHCPSSSHEESDASFYARDASFFIPSYLIVQRQMKDVVLTQKMAVEQLVRNNIDVLNASRASFSATVQLQQEKLKMLQRTIEEDYVAKHMFESLNEKLKEEFVPKKTFESLQQQLKTECERHSETQLKLQGVLDKLNASLHHITVITSQMAQDKASFNSVYDTLKEELSEVHRKNKDLETRLKEQTSSCQRQGEKLSHQEEEISMLHQKQKDQMMKYKQIATETEVERQQEAYLSRMLNDVNKKKK